MAAAIHFAVIFEHFNEYVLYGAFFLIISWARAIWAAVVLWRPSRTWLWLGIAGNAIIVAVYLVSRTTGLPFGPDNSHPETYGALDAGRPGRAARRRMRVFRWVCRDRLRPGARHGRYWRRVPPAH